MPRLARVVIPEVAHHITQRGNRRQKVFFCDEDYRYYLTLLYEWRKACGLTILAYCLMPNHVHLVAIPPDEPALTKAFSEIHRRYSRHVNLREEWRGHLWQNRFASFPLGPTHLYHALRYIDENPVRACLTSHPEHWPWSSIYEYFHAPERNIIAAAELGKIGYPFENTDAEFDSELLRRHERTGRPLGDADFVAELEAQTGRVLAPQKPGRKSMRG